MIRFTSKAKYTLIFQFLVEGKIKESDLMGALLTLSSSIHPQYGLTKLQNDQKVGKISFTLTESRLQSEAQRTRGLVEIPCSLEKSDGSILCAVLESISKVGLFNSVFRLKQIVPSEKINYQRILKRALEVHNTHFELSETEIDLKKALLDLTSSSKAVSLGNFTLGASFYDSSNVIVVEGRKDVLTLSECGITNTLALGGYNFEEEKAAQLLMNKTITIFLDGDKGGQQIQKKLVKLVPVKYIIPVPPKRSVEDLKRSEVYQLIKNRQIYSE